MVPRAGLGRQPYSTLYHLHHFQGLALESENWESCPSSAPYLMHGRVDTFLLMVLIFSFLTYKTSNCSECQVEYLN